MTDVKQLLVYSKEGNTAPVLYEKSFKNKLY
jgi:hypothetical protein